MYNNNQRKPVQTYKSKTCSNVVQYDVSIQHVWEENVQQDDTITLM